MIIIDFTHPMRTEDSVLVLVSVPTLALKSPKITMSAGIEASMELIIIKISRWLIGFTGRGDRISRSINRKKKTVV
jgi:hypothetical protein